MVVSDIDIRLLRVFKAVAESSGYTSAQAILGVSQSTISTQMSQLEVRIGFSLCHRGRGGFRLTTEGEAFYSLVSNFFQSVSDFQTQTSELKRGLGGTLRIGFLDNVITDKSNPIKSALSRFVQHPDSSVQIMLESLPPAAMEKGLLDGSLDVAIGIFDDRISGLDYARLYDEYDILACHHTHPLAQLKDPQRLAEALLSAKRVTRAFLGCREFSFDDTSDASVSVTSLEASAMLILTGQYIGYLPLHYAKPWLDSGELVSLIPEKFERYSKFSLVTKNSATIHSRPLTHFVDCVSEACGANSESSQQVS